LEHLHQVNKVNQPMNKGISQEKLAEMLGINKASIANYETGRRSLTIDKLEELLKCLDTTITDFFCSDKMENLIDTNKTLKNIPIITKISVEKNYNSSEYLKLPISIAQKVDFATFMLDDSMEPEIKDFDLLFVQDTQFLENGAMGIFFLNENIYCKRFFKNPIENKITLKSINPKYKPINIQDNDNFKIIGKNQFEKGRFACDYGGYL